MKNPTALPTALAAALVAALAAGPAAHAGTDTMVAASAWGLMHSVSGNVSGSDRLFYEFAVTPDQPLRISVTFTPSDYIPGRYDPGFISPGWFAVTRPCYPTCGYEGNVIFEMQKRYGVDFASNMTQILIGDGGRVEAEVADYVPGASYVTTMTWDRAARTIDIDVGGNRRTVASYGEAISGLVFYGPNDVNMTSAFGQVSVMTQPVPEPGSWALLLAGLAALGWMAGRRPGTAHPARAPRP